MSVSYRLKVNWRRVRKVWEIYTFRWGCGRKEWITFHPLLFSQNKTVFGLIGLNVEYWVPRDMWKHPFYLLFEVGKGDIFPPATFSLNVRRKVAEMEWADKLLLRTVGLDEYCVSLSRGNKVIIPLTKDLDERKDHVSVNFKPLKGVISSFGDCLISTYRRGEDRYTLLSDGNCYLLLDCSPTDLEVDEIPIVRHFLKGWNYKVTVSRRFYYFPIDRGMWLICPRLGENPAGRFVEFCSSPRQNFIPLTVPVWLYENIIEEVTTKKKHVTPVSTSPAYQLLSYPLKTLLSFKTEMEIPFIHLKVKVKGDRGKFINLTQLLGYRKRWWEIFLPRQHKSNLIRFLIPVRKESEFLIIENPETQFPQLLVRAKVVGGGDGS